MQSGEKFMRNFFRARTIEIKRELERRIQFRKSFFYDSCFWDSRKGSIERSKAETIESVATFDAEIQVITREIEPFPRLLYHLKIAGKNWLIYDVAFECIRCAGKAGNSTCSTCLGHGWVHQDSLKRTERLKNQIRQMGNNPR